MIDDLSKIESGNKPSEPPQDETGYFRDDSDRMQNALIEIEVQRKTIRIWAVYVAVAVIFGAAALEGLIVHRLLYSYQPDTGFLAAWAISPIVSITIVTTFLLLGAFRENKEDPSDSVVSNLASALLRLTARGSGSS